MLIVERWERPHPSSSMRDFLRHFGLAHQGDIPNVASSAVPAAVGPFLTEGMMVEPMLVSVCDSMRNSPTASEISD